MEQELVTLTQPTADDTPLLAGGRLRIAHTISAAHDIHYSVCTIRNPNDDLQGITPSILHRLLTPTRSTLPRPFIAAKSRYRDVLRHSWQAIRLFATECSDAQLPERDKRFPAEGNAADIITTLRRTQNITRANDTRRGPINIRYLYRVENTKENCTYLPRDHFVTKLGIVSTHYPIDEWADTDDDIFGNEENSVHDTEATPTFLPGGERTGDESPDTPCRKAAAGTNASAAGMMPFFTETKIPLTSLSIFSQAVSTIGEKNTISLPVANSGNTDMNNASNVWQKIAEHIDYYYWNPPPGYPPRWLNVIVFIISLYLWMFAWAPIKVKTTEILQLSPENGDEVYLKENTGEKFGHSKSHMFTDWMRLEINQKDYWCICRMNFCPHGPSTTFRPPKVRKKLTEIKEIIIINKENCLVTKSVINNSKNEKGIELSVMNRQIVRYVDLFSKNPVLSFRGVIYGY